MNAPHSRPGKAVIPAAGLGTRFLPATKAVPKEMLPVVDKPAIQYVVEEAVAAGLTDVLMITGRNKRPLEDHFDRNVELELALKAKGDDARLAAVDASSDMAAIHYVRQGDPRGLGHAVLVAAEHVGNESFAVLLGDDLIDERDPLLSRMLEVQRERGGKCRRADGGPAGADRAVRVCRGGQPPRSRTWCASAAWWRSRRRRRPRATLAVIGRYVLHPAVFDVLRTTSPGRGGEIQLTDALQTLATMTADSGGTCTAWCSEAAATTPVTAATTSRPSSGSPASGPTSGLTS